MAYATLDNLRAQLPYRTIDADSKPTQAEAQTWLDDAENWVNQALKAGDLPAPYTAAAAVSILRQYVLLYAVGRVKIAYADAGGDYTNDDGRREVEEFNSKIKDILQQPETMGAMLGGGSSGSSGGRLRAYTTNNTDGKTISAGDFKPTFKRGDLL